MTNQNLDTIIRELNTIDPSLESQEADMRALIVALIESRPDTLVDHAFIRRLRSELLSRAVTSATTRTRHGVSWWMLGLAPFAAVVLLLVIILPQLATEQSKPQIPAVMPVPSGATNLAEPATQQTELQTIPNTLAPDGAATLAQEISSNSINVSTQKPGAIVIVDFVAFERSSYVAIHEDTGGKFGAIIGTSGELPAGRSEHVAIMLDRATSDGETLYAALYASNEDGVFNTRTDLPIRDAITKDPMYIVFVVSPDATEGEMSR